jgi:hypothetical protein
MRAFRDRSIGLRVRIPDVFAGGGGRRERRRMIIGRAPLRPVESSGSQTQNGFCGREATFREVLKIILFQLDMPAARCGAAIAGAQGQRRPPVDRRRSMNARPGAAGLANRGAGRNSWPLHC